MNENDTAEVEGIDLPSDAYRLGVDGEGREHWHSPMGGHLWTLRSGDLVHEESLTETSVVEWVLFVADLCGWEERHPVEEAGGLGGIVDDVTTALDGGEA